MSAEKEKYYLDQLSSLKRQAEKDNLDWSNIAGITHRTLTPDHTAEIRERLEAATPGPWEIQAGANQIYTAPDENGIRYRIAMADLTTLGNWPDNRDFIANAPTDIAHLLAENERLRAIIEALTPTQSAPPVSGRARTALGGDT